MGDENEKKYDAIGRAWGIPTKPIKKMRESKLRRVLKYFKIIS